MRLHREYQSFARAGVRGRAVEAGRAPWRKGAGEALLVRGFLSLAAALADTGAILLAALLAGTAYHAAFYEAAGMYDAHAAVGAILAALFVPFAFARKDYEIASLVAPRGRLRRVVALWNLSFLCFLILAFLSKTSAEVSRGAIVLFYLLGALGLGGSRTLMARLVLDRTRAGGVGARRVFLVGDEYEIQRFTDTHDPARHGMRIIAAAVLRGEETLDDDLALAAASARILRPDDVFIIAPWSRTALIEATVNVFLRVPAALHMGPERVLDRFTDARLDRFGDMASLELIKKPLGVIDICAKRAFDTAVASLALIALAPVFALLALAIKLDSRGPVFFLQRRYGFNQEPFRIFKFRSMTSLDDGRSIAQARPGDARITRVGAFIRRFNLDELPQLLNVLRGEMSLVGPRPHALAHDQMYEREIALYARRHNVRPGITGWAQVNGLRGETSTNEKMKARVEHDLWYIDNWSLALDLRILWLTVFSRKAYRNAI